MSLLTLGKRGNLPGRAGGIFGQFRAFSGPKAVKPGTTRSKTGIFGTTRAICGFPKQGNFSRPRGRAGARARGAPGNSGAGPGRAPGFAEAGASPAFLGNFAAAPCGPGVFRVNSRRWHRHGAKRYKFHSGRAKHGGQVGKFHGVFCGAGLRWRGAGVAGQGQRCRVPPVKN